MEWSSNIQFHIKLETFEDGLEVKLKFELESLMKEKCSHLKEHE